MDLNACASQIANALERFEILLFKFRHQFSVKRMDHVEVHCKYNLRKKIIGVGRGGARGGGWVPGPPNNLRGGGATYPSPPQ